MENPLTISKSQIESLSGFLAERLKKMLRGELYWVDGEAPSNPHAATIVDTTYMLIELVNLGVTRDNAIDALRDVMWNAFSSAFPNSERTETKGEIDLEMQTFLLDQHLNGDDESRSRVAIYAAHLLFDFVDTKENMDVLGKVAALLLFGGDIGIVLKETRRIVENE